MRGDTPELRLRIRVMNYGRYDVGFWDDSFRLAVGGDVLSPTSGLNTSVPGNSLRYGIVTFRLRPQTRAGVLRIVNTQQTAEIPLDLSPTGRPPVDEQAEIADSSARPSPPRSCATRRAAGHRRGDRDAPAGVDAALRQHTAFHAVAPHPEPRTLRRPQHAPSRCASTAGGEQSAPFHFPNETIAAAATATGTVGLRPADAPRRAPCCARPSAIRRRRRRSN